MNKWCIDDEQYLRTYYSIIPTRQIAKELHKTHTAIWKKAKKLGLSLSKEMQFKNRSLSHKGILLKGGRKKNYKGYILILNRNHPRADMNGYVFEHIVVAEKSIGRDIGQDEIVHHINGIKDDNRPENLIVLSRAEHTALHNKRRREVV